MSNLARKIQQEQRSKTLHETRPKREKRFRITLGEKILGGIFCIALCFLGIQIIGNQVAIYELNKDIQKTSASISDQKLVNDDLQAQVDKLSSYDRILKKAKELGLKLNENNVKVVQK